MPSASSHRLRALAADESGQASVEFALVLPLLVTLILGMVGFGFALNYWIDETQLASSAARYAAVARNPAGTGTLQDFIRTQASAEGLEKGGTQSTPDPLEICVTYQNGAATKAGDWVRVEIKSDYRFFPGLDLVPITITGSATMRLERPPNFTVVPSGCS